MESIAPQSGARLGDGGWKTGWKSSWILLRKGRERLRKRAKLDQHSPGEIEVGLILFSVLA